MRSVWKQLKLGVFWKNQNEECLGTAKMRSVWKQLKLGVVGGFSVMPVN